MTEDIVREFKQFFKKNRLAEKEKVIEEKTSMVMKQIKNLVGENNE
jgi:hypothetical protein